MALYHGPGMVQAARVVLAKAAGRLQEVEGGEADQQEEPEHDGQTQTLCQDQSAWCTRFLPASLA
jgi:hypothetical protein